MNILSIITNNNLTDIFFVSAALLVLVLTLIPLSLTGCTEKVDMSHNAVYSSIIATDDKYYVNYIIATGDNVFYFYDEEVDSTETIGYLFAAKERIIANGTRFVCQSTTKNNNKAYVAEFKEGQKDYSFTIEVKSYGEIHVVYTIVNNNTSTPSTTGVYGGSMTFLYSV